MLCRAEVGREPYSDENSLIFFLALFTGLQSFLIMWRTSKSGNPSLNCFSKKSNLLPEISIFEREEKEVLVV